MIIRKTDLSGVSLSGPQPGEAYAWSRLGFGMVWESGDEHFATAVDKGWIPIAVAVRTTRWRLYTQESSMLRVGGLVEAILMRVSSMNLTRRNDVVT
jgi:hypothetical protein